MEPKEKAIELVDKFRMNVLDYEGSGLNTFKAKQCALIAVDEMLNEYPSQCPKDSYEMERHIYWQEVKQEIEKL